jgi:hypothetical protein
MRLFLYTKPDCPLCDEAREIVRDVVGGAVLLEEVDISDDEMLSRRYGKRIPVLRRADDATEIDWPFGPSDVSQLVQL